MQKRAARERECEKKTLERTRSWARGWLVARGAACGRMVCSRRESSRRLLSRCAVVPFAALIARDEATQASLDPDRRLRRIQQQQKQCSTSRCATTTTDCSRRQAWTPQKAECVDAWWHVPMLIATEFQLALQSKETSVSVGQKQDNERRKQH